MLDTTMIPRGIQDAGSKHKVSDWWYVVVQSSFMVLGTLGHFRSSEGLGPRLLS